MLEQVLNSRLQFNSFRKVFPLNLDLKYHHLNDNDFQSTLGSHVYFRPCYTYPCPYTYQLKNMLPAYALFGTLVIFGK